MFTYTITTTFIFLLGLLIGNIRKKTLMRTIEIDYGFRDKEQEIPYLIRYTIFKCKYFSLKLHKTLISDPAEPHDHPWNYTSLILWGGYFEFTYRTNRSENILEDQQWYGPGSLLHRKGDKLHRLIIPEGKFCISLILTTKRFREWGFMTNKVWKNYNEAVGYAGRMDRKAHQEKFKESTKQFIRQRLTKEDYS